MPKYSAPTSGTDAYIDQGGTSVKHMSSSPAYDHLMHKRHPAFKGAGFESCGKGTCITMTGKGGKTGPETPQHSYHSSGKNVVIK